MRKKRKPLRQLLHLATLLAVAVYASSCEKSTPNESRSYRLSRGGYSPDAGAVLLALHFHGGERAGTTVLVMYVEREQSMNVVYGPPQGKLFDFAWSPTRDTFAVTHGSGVALFRKDGPEENYQGTTVQCLIDVLYTHCAWSPSGEWLAVVCFDLEKASENRLGLYKVKDETFMITELSIDPRPLIWEDDTTLHAVKNGNILEVGMRAGNPRLIRSTPLDEGVSEFCGMFGNRPLVRKGRDVFLGDKVLIELDSGEGRRVIATKSLIFVSASATDFTVFNHHGHEVGKASPGKVVYLGSIGEDSRTVYGLAGSMLLRVHLDNTTLKVEDVSDLDGFH